MCSTDSSLPKLVICLGVATSATFSILNPFTLIVDLASTVTVQAVDENGDLQTAGGDLILLRVEQLCTLDANDDCILSANQDSVPGLPIEEWMTDNGDGTYQADVTMSGQGSVTVSALIYSSGLVAEYFNNSNLLAPAAFT